MYVVSTSRPSAAAFGAAVGLFCGAAAASYVAVNRGTFLSLFVCRAGDLGIDHVQDFHLSCTLKYVVAVPIVEPAAPHKVSRHLLFLCTVKQEVVLVALEKMSEPTSGESDPVAMVTLFTSEPEDCLYQFEPGEVELCCCSTPVLTDSTTATVASPATSAPFVAFALTRGELLFFDVFAALARDAMKRKRSSHFPRFFSHEFIMQLVPHGKPHIFTQSYVDCTEYDLRDISFGCPTLAAGPLGASASAFSSAAAAQRSAVPLPRSSAGGSAPLLPFYVLYADPYGKVHVSVYELAVFHGGEGGAAHTSGSARPSPRLSAPNSSPSTSRVQRRGYLQSNVDPTASRIVSSRHGLFVVGNQLVTLIQQARPRKTVSSREIPSRHGALDVSCATVSTGASELVIGFSDGVLVRVAVASSDLAGEDAELEFSFLPQPAPTIPTEVVALRSDLYLLCSRFDSTFTVRLGDMTCERVLHNCGPVLDMTTQQNGPRCSVVTCTGLHRNGGVSILRTAVMLREQAAIPLQHNPQRVLCAGGLLCVTSAVINRFFRIAVRSSAVDELSLASFPDAVARSPLLELGYDGTLDQVVLVSARAIVWMRVRGSRCEEQAKLPRRRDEPEYLFATSRYGLLALSDGSSVTVYRGQDSVFTIPSAHGIALSALSLVSSTLLAVGDWGGHVSLYELKRPQPQCIGELRLDSVPHSIASVLPQPSAFEKMSSVPQLVYIGTLHGCLVETTAELMREGSVRRTIPVASHPLELQELGGHAGLLCLGNIPLVVLCKPEGVQLTGLHLMGVSAAAIVDVESQCYALYSQQDCQLHVGCLESLEKTTRTFLPLGETVTQLHEVAPWSGCAVSVRKVERDEIIFLPSALLQRPWGANLSVYRDGAVPLLENERCVFLQSLHLDGLGETEGGGADRAPQDEGPSVLLVGSSFTFPDEQRARSGRMTWFTLREARQRRQLHMIAGKDISGALQCCAVVPHYKGRIAVGVNGCVCLYKWDAEDQTFIAEERVRVGLTVTKLMPLYNTKLASSVLVALDVRYSAFFVEVDTLQGSLRVLCRDANLRGVMDGYVASDEDNLCVFDDNFNFTAMRVVQLAAQANPDGGAATPAPQFRFEVRAQCHLGDVVTCVQPGTFAATALTRTDSPAPAAVVDSASAPPLLLPGINGPQLVFATVSGAFGVLTPLSLPTYVVLRAVELALERATARLAGLSHTTFKDVLRPGQERGINLVASKTGGLLSRDRLKRYEAINTVDGDFVEGFARLGAVEKTHVCRMASEMVASVYLARLNEDGAFVAAPPSQEQCPLPDSTPTTSLSTYSADTVAKVNDFLAAGELPPLPLSPSDLDRLIVNLQRVH